MIAPTLTSTFEKLRNLPGKPPRPLLRDPSHWYEVGREEAEEWLRSSSRSLVVKRNFRFSETFDAWRMGFLDILGDNGYTIPNDS